MAGPLCHWYVLESEKEGATLTANPFEIPRPSAWLAETDCMVESDWETVSEAEFVCDWLVVLPHESVSEPEVPQDSEVVWVLA